MLTPEGVSDERNCYKVKLAAARNAGSGLAALG